MSALESLIEISKQCYWSAGIHHSWIEGRGARKSTNSSIASLRGEFRTKAEAIQALKIAIESRSLRSNVHSINYDTATPSISFHIPHKLKEAMGDIFDAINSEKGPQNV